MGVFMPGIKKRSYIQNKHFQISQLRIFNQYSKF